MFALLSALVSRFGALWMLELQPDIIDSSLQSLENASHCQAVTNFLRELLTKALLECRRGGAYYRFNHQILYTQQGE